MPGLLGAVLGKYQPLASTLLHLVYSSKTLCRYSPSTCTALVVNKLITGYTAVYISYGTYFNHR